MELSLSTMRYSIQDKAPLNKHAILAEDYLNPGSEVLKYGFI